MAPKKSIATNPTNALCSQSIAKYVAIYFSNGRACEEPGCGRLAVVDPRIGTELAGHRIERVVGQGGASVVYLAEHLRLARKVALKVLAPHLAEDEAFRERFIRESRMAAALDHPNVVTIYDAGEVDNNLYISMRYVEGSDLSRLLRVEGILETSRMLLILSQIASALDLAHGQGLIHRDVKPANVLVEMLGGFERAYLSDFGISKHTLTGSGLTRTGQFVGTVDYVAPEQITGEPIDGRTDVYSLGCVLFQCLAGQVPFPREIEVATIYSQLHDAPPRLGDIVEAPAQMDEVLARALSKSKEARYPTCGALVEAARVSLGAAGETQSAFRPAVSRSAPGMRRTGMIPETRYAKTVDGFNVAYQTLGEGPTDVITVGAYFSHLEHDWTSPEFASESRELAELGRLIQFDARGTGLSDRLRDGRLPSLEERIDDLRAVLDAASSERAVLVAFANGGPLSCLFAATYPERTKALVLCNTAPRTAWAPDYPWGMSPEKFKAESESTETRWGTRELAAEIVQDITPDRAKDEALVEWWAESMRLSASPSAAALLLRMYYDMDVRDILSAIHVPTLVLAGDPAAQESEAMARRIPGALFTHVPTTARYVVSDPDPFHAEIRRFVLRVGEEETDLDRVLATVLFTDIVGSAELAATRGDRAWHELIERHHAFVRGAIVRWRGREMDTAGDGFLATFDGPARAIRCARTIIDGVRSMGIEIRAGLHTGECDITDDKLSGITVMIGSRIAALAAPSEVLVSQTVKDLVAGSGLVFEARGEHELKGVPDQWRLYAVASD
jgi:serine/threonine protein kinase/class 3 adenylate cyclase